MWLLKFTLLLQDCTFSRRDITMSWLQYCLGSGFSLMHSLLWLYHSKGLDHLITNINSHLLNKQVKHSLLLFYFLTKMLISWKPSMFYSLMVLEPSHRATSGSMSGLRSVRLHSGTLTGIFPIRVSKWARLLPEHDWEGWSQVIRLLQVLQSDKSQWPASRSSVRHVSN